jgi:hypothetical protein
VKCASCLLLYSPAARINAHGLVTVALWQSKESIRADIAAPIFLQKIRREDPLFFPSTSSGALDTCLS